MSRVGYAETIRVYVMMNRGNYW